MAIGMENGVFVLALLVASAFFYRSIARLRQAIALGQPADRSDRPKERWATMARVAMGQSKMGARPVAAFLHLLVYVGFVLINIEMLEILADGLLGTHRLFSGVLGPLYPVAIGFFEMLSVLVLLGCVFFLLRRSVWKVQRLNHPDLEGFPRKDAYIILYTEVCLMAALLVMNSSEAAATGHGFFVSNHLSFLFTGLDIHTLHWVERGAWWFHLIGILLFLNYLPFSKHFHIVLAFPNTYFSKLTPKGQLDSMPSVTHEVKAMLDPSYVPPVTDIPARFGAKDVNDLRWINLLNAFTCTECGRCTSECPANQTGKKLSPRRIMMATRDRAETYKPEDGLSLLDHGISREELWACTSCNACTEACPIGIDPLDIIIQMRQYIVMEESGAPLGVQSMMTNIENNGAPWPFAQADRGSWTSE